MLHVLGCITQQHDLRLVGLAALLCLFASTTAMSMIARGRAAQGTVQTVWLLTGGFVAGCGIWGLHFVAMLAYRAGLPVAYDLPRTALSVLVAAVLCAAGFRLAMSKAGPAIGGAVAGVAISAMHYVGMSAVLIPADAIWDANYVLASLIIGVAASSLALHVALTRNDFKGYAIGATLFLIAIVGMHFTGMSAVTFRPDPAVGVSGVVIEPGILAVAVASVSALVMALGLIGALVDHHLAARATGEAERLRAHVAELEETKCRLERASGELRVALANADAANDAKSQFLAAMSHELRTPLNAVIGFSEVLTMETFGPLGNPRYLGYARDIHDSGAHLLSLINDILDLSRLDAAQMTVDEKEIGVADLVAAALRMTVDQAAKAEVVLAREIAPNPPRLLGDRRRLQQVLLNLVSNAIKFTPGGGTVTVRAFFAGGEFAIAVTDTGIGMRAEDIPLAFERFHQIDSALSRKYEGAGLGLPLARKLVELHGGRLVLESQLQEGTTATIYLPPERVLAAARAVA